MKKLTLSKLLALVLVFALCLGAAPVSAFAVTQDEIDAVRA